jgi:hypothetical protein
MAGLFYERGLSTTDRSGGRSLVPVAAAPYLPDLARSLSRARSTVAPVGTCSGSLILHADGTIAGCTNDEDGDGCVGIELRHQGDPHRCIDWWGECNYCGIVYLGAR